MEIEVGEYVRLARNQGINKIIDEDDDGFLVLDEIIADEYGEECFEISLQDVDKEIVKHSKNIIDLIEVGDYVNGYKVISIDTNAPNNCKECIELDRNNAYEYQWISRNEIETILTKEQYQANYYTVRRKEEC